MYHLFGGDYDDGARMDGYAGVFETLAAAGAHALKKDWEWAGAALLNDGRLEKVATWEARQIAGRDTIHPVVQNGWVMTDGTFMVIASEEVRPWPKGGVVLGNAWAPADNLMAGSVWPGVFVGYVGDDDQDDK